MKKFDGSTTSTSGAKASVVAFSAEWCPPCKVMAPIYEAAAARYTNLDFSKVNQEDAPELFQRFGVQSIPTYLVLKDGKEVHRQVGAVPASRFQAMLERFIA
jgi:thioredoxin